LAAENTLTTLIRALRAGLILACLLGSTASHAGTLNVLVTTPDGTPLSSAVVTAMPLGQESMTVKPGSKAVMIQEGKQFKPFVLPIQRGTTVEFPNRDPFRHQVYSFASAKTFELKLYGSSVVGTVTFDKEGIIPLGCNIHDNMLAYIYVVGTPHFVSTAEGGEGSIARLPAGDYAVKVWHPNQKAGEGDIGIVHIAADDSTDITVQIDVKRLRTQRKPGAIDENEY
jgi:plastocyanin